MLICLNNKQREWIIQQIEDEKANANIHDINEDSLMDWEPGHFDMVPEEFLFLKSIFDAVRPE